MCIVMGYLHAYRVIKPRNWILRAFYIINNYIQYVSYRKNRLHVLHF